MTSKKFRRHRTAAVPPSGFEIALPATSANLGPAFDAAALALNLFLKIRASISKEFSIRATGRDQDICNQT